LVICLERGAYCLHTAQLMPLHPKTPSPLASFKSRQVLPFWYWLTQALVLLLLPPVHFNGFFSGTSWDPGYPAEKKPLNGTGGSTVVA